MRDSTGNIYFPGATRPRQRSNSDDNNVIPFIAPLFHPYLGAAGNPQNISVQFMHSCPAQDTTQLDSDILHSLDHDATTATYPESSQRTTSYPTEAPGFTDYPDLATFHATQTFRRGSWPSHSQTAYSHWMQSPPRIARSPVSEPPESTSDESYQDSDVEETTQMSPMLNQFQIHSSRNISQPPHHSDHTFHSQALQPSVMIFQLSETMLQPVDDPETGRMLSSAPDMSIVADDTLSSLSNLPPPSSIPFGSAGLQGCSMRQHDSEMSIEANQFRVPVPASNTIPFPSPHSLANARTGDQRSPGSKQQKKSKMHQCPQCNKMFPRPSGLATHMNTHSGAKPYKCIVANCEKSFAVRSNAKRHLRTHGINPSSPDMLSRPRFTVGFEEPMVTQVHDAGRQPSRYRWIPHNPLPHEQDWPQARQGSSSFPIDVPHTGITFQTSMSSTTSNGSDDDYEELQVASSSVTNVQGWSRGDCNNGDTNECTGTYPIYSERSRRG